MRFGWADCPGSSVRPCVVAGRSAAFILAFALTACSECGGVRVTPMSEDSTGIVRTTPPDRGHFEVAVYYVTTPARDPVAAFRSECPGIAVTDVLGAPGAPAAIVAMHDDYGAPDVEMLAYFGRGLTEADAMALQHSAAVLVATMDVAPEGARGAVRELTTCVARVAQPSGFVWDEETQLMHSLEAWRAGPVADWDDGVPSFGEQVTVHAMRSDTDTSLRAVSLGMRKFARSDLVVPSFEEQHFETLGRLLAYVGQTMLEGAEPAGHVHLDATTLRDAHAPTIIGTATGMDVDLEPARAEPGDPENRLLAPVFPGAPWSAVVERQATLLAAVFSTDREISHVDPDAELLALSRTMRAELVALRDRFVVGLPTGHRLNVAANFAHENGAEVMWVELSSWPDDEHVMGRLLNEPEHVPELHSGSSVTVPFDDVIDYELVAPEGRVAGGAAYRYAIGEPP